jgi:O-antigen/teichoic acid export membrane protein
MDVNDNLKFNAVSETGDFFASVWGDLIRILPGFLAQILSGFGVSLLIGRYISPEVNGQYTLILLAVGYAISLLTGWIQNAIVRFVPENKAWYKSYFNFLFLLVVVSTLLVALFGIASRGYLDFELANTDLVISVGLFALMASYQSFQSLLRGSFKTGVYGIALMLLAILKVALLVLLVQFFTDELRAMLFTMVLAYSITLFFQSWNIIKKRRDFGPVHSFQDGQIQHIIQKSFEYGFPLSISLFILSLLQSGERWVVAGLVSPAEFGVYTFWMALGLQFGRTLYRVMFIAMNPRLFELLQSSPQRALAYVKRIMMAYVVLLLPALAGIAVVLPSLLSWVGVKTVYLQSAGILVFPLAAAFFMGLAQLAGKPIEFSNRTTIITWASVIACAILFGLVYVLTPNYGLIGAGISSLAAFIGYFGVIAAKAKNWPPLKASLLAIVVSGIVFVLKSILTWKLGITIAVPIVIVLLSIYLSVMIVIGLRNRQFRLKPS